MRAVQQQQDDQREIERIGIENGGVITLNSHFLPSNVSDHAYRMMVFSPVQFYIPPLAQIRQGVRSEDMPANYRNRVDHPANPIIPRNVVRAPVMYNVEFMSEVVHYFAAMRTGRYLPFYRKPVAKDYSVTYLLRYDPRDLLMIRKDTSTRAIIARYRADVILNQLIVDQVALAGIPAQQRPQQFIQGAEDPARHQNIRRAVRQVAQRNRDPNFNNPGEGPRAKTIRSLIGSMTNVKRVIDEVDFMTTKHFERVRQCQVQLQRFVQEDIVTANHIDIIPSMYRSCAQSISAMTDLIKSKSSNNVNAITDRMPDILETFFPEVYEALSDAITDQGRGRVGQFGYETRVFLQRNLCDPARFISKVIGTPAIINILRMLVENHSPLHVVCAAINIPRAGLMVYIRQLQARLLATEHGPGHARALDTLVANQLRLHAGQGRLNIPDRAGRNVINTDEFIIRAFIQRYNAMALAEERIHQRELHQNAVPQ